MNTSLSQKKSNLAVTLSSLHLLVTMAIMVVCVAAEMKQPWLGIVDGLLIAQLTPWALYFITRVYWAEEKDGGANDSAWSPEKRIRSALLILNEMEQEAIKGSIVSRRVIAYKVRMSMVLSMSADWLEKNRERVLASS